MNKDLVHHEDLFFGNPGRRFRVFSPETNYQLFHYPTIYSLSSTRSYWVNSAFSLWLTRRILNKVS